MTIPNSYSPTRLAIAGTDYDFTFNVVEATDLLVYTLTGDVPTLLTQGVDYIVDLDEVGDGGTIQTGSYIMAVWTPAEPAGDEILISRNTPYSQPTDIPVRGGFNEPIIEGALDHLARQIQQLKYLYDQIVEVDPTAGNNILMAAQAAQAAAEAAQAAAEAAAAAAEQDVEGAIDALTDITTGHRHDGTDARKVLMTSLDVTGLTAGKALRINAGGTAVEVFSGANFEIFKASGSWVAPTGVTRVLVFMVGGGGGGGGTGANANAAAGGGGGGASALGIMHTVTPGNSYTVTIGAGGAAGAASDTPGGDGGAGGTTSFDTLSVAGGSGGKGDAGAGGLGGAGAVGGFNASGITPGGFRFAGGNGGNGTASGDSGGGGSTPLGVGAVGKAQGGGAAVAAAANTGGGGGGAVDANAVGGAGGSGLVVLLYNVPTT